MEADRNQAEVNEFLNIVMTAVRISKRRSELFGLDAPRQLEVSGLAGGAIRTDVGDLLITRLAELRDKQGPLAEELDKEPLIVEIPSETALEPSLDE